MKKENLMITVNELVMNQKSIAEIAAIKSNVLLTFQVLLIIGLLDKGVFPQVKLSVKSDSNIEGDIIMCSGHSFIVTSQSGYIGNVSFTDIDYLEIKKEVSNG
jgi:hypothetical protein